MACSAFEWTAWSTYQAELYAIQAALSAAMSTETLRLQHQLRNAFTNEEALGAKNALARITASQERYAPI